MRILSEVVFRLCALVVRVPRIVFRGSIALITGACGLALRHWVLAGSAAILAAIVARWAP